MTAAEWQTCTDPLPMLESLQGSATGWRGSIFLVLGIQPQVRRDRKARLFGCACCRRVWHLLGSEPCCRKAVETAEQYADGEASREQLRAARQAAHARRLRLRAEEGDKPVCAGRLAVRAAEVAAEANAWHAARRASLVAREAANTGAIEEMVGGLQGQRWLGSPQFVAFRQGQASRQCDLLRDIFGSPFAPLPAVDPSLLTWSDGLVAKLAVAAYEDHHLPHGTLDASRLAVLADALEDVGWADADILNHLRGPGPHVRGCWAVDLLLGKA
jgi:hypothetical protein